MLKQAQKKQEQFERQSNLLSKSNPFDGFAIESKSGEKETSLKTFYKEFKKVVEAADVLIEVLDARDPLGSRCPQVEEMIMNSGSSKKLVLLLNKIDLVPKQNVQAWLKFLRSQYPTVAFKSSTQNQNEKLVKLLINLFLLTKTWTPKLDIYSVHYLNKQIKLASSMSASSRWH